MNSLFEIKEDVVLEDIQKLHPAIWIIFTAALLYCKRNNLTCRITSLINDRGSLGRKVRSRTHGDGRAIDLGIRAEDGWTDTHVQRLCHKLNTDYSDIAAISASDYQPRSAIPKPDHIHLQCRNVSMEELNKFIKE